VTLIAGYAPDRGDAPHGAAAVPVNVLVARTGSPVGEQVCGRGRGRARRACRAGRAKAAGADLDDTQSGRARAPLDLATVNEPLISVPRMLNALCAYRGGLPLTKSWAIAFLTAALFHDAA
jgi:hypothetical protein